MKRKIHTADDFDWISWRPTDIKKIAEDSMEQKRERHEKIKAVPADERTFENTILEIEKADAELHLPSHKIALLMNVSESEDVRNACRDALVYIDQQLIDIEYDPGMFQAVVDFEKRKQSLGDDEEKLFSDMIKSYRRMGFALPEDQREKLKKNLKRIGELGLQFDKNINEYKDQIIISPAETEGLSEQYLSGLSKDEAGNYIVSLNYPEYIPFMENARNREKRKELGNKYMHKGGLQNIEILKEVLRLRKENAELLGYRHHADYQIEIRTAEKTENVLSFLKELSEQLEPGLKKDIESLTKTATELDGVTKLEFYDILYYINQEQKLHYKVDQEKVREYFPLDRAISSMFRIFGTIFNIDFKEVDLPKWHPDVRWYEVSDKTEGFLGYFATDLFPRENKFSHAAVFSLGEGHAISDEEYFSPIAALVTNFRKPNGNIPSLLNHDELTTLFHEFGHTIHHMVTTVPYTTKSGTMVSRDFVEIPSQLFENWAWDKELLKSLSGHYSNPEQKLDDETIDKLIAGRNHAVSYSTRRQIVLGLYDMELHTSNDKDLVELYSSLYQDLIHVSPPKDQIFAAGFGHLMGYDAGYYSYLWSLVSADDIFSKFLNSGLLNTEVGKELRDKVLSRGSIRKEMTLLEDFLGRKTNNEAFLKRLGLK
jgi:thimet oligopeptidase